jgi:superfamily II DNA or RNA helicase
MATKKNLENKEIAYNHAIKEINQHIFKSSGGKKSTITYGLPEYDPNIKSLDDILKDAERENEDNRMRKFVEEFLPKLNEEQKKVKDIIDDSIQKDLNKLIYIDAPGGSGKTFLFNLIIASLKLDHKPVSVCAHSGVSYNIYFEMPGIHKSSDI